MLVSGWMELRSSHSWMVYPRELPLFRLEVCDHSNSEDYHLEVLMLMNEVDRQGFSCFELRVGFISGVGLKAIGRGGSSAYP